MTPLNQEKLKKIERLTKLLKMMIEYKEDDQEKVNAVHERILELTEELKTS